MKNLRKVFSMLVAVVMGLSLAVPAFADGETPEPAGNSATGGYQITIEANPADTVEHTYTAYQVFKADISHDNNKTLSNIKWDEVLKSNFENKIIKKVTKNAEGNDVTENKSYRDLLEAVMNITLDKAKEDPTAIVEWLKEKSNDSADVDSFASVTMEYIHALKELNPSVTLTKVVSENAGKGNKDQILNLASGYYVIEDNNTGSEDTKPDGKTSVSRYIVGVAGPLTMKAKSTLPTIDKKIVGRDFNVKETKDNNRNVIAYDYNKTGEQYVKGDRSVASLGEAVKYQLSSKVPDMTGYNSYWFNMKDRLSKGLTFNYDPENLKDAVEVKVDGDVISKEDYDVKLENPVVATDGTTTFTVIFKDFYNKHKDKKDQKITVEYTATVNKDAIIGENGNPNYAWLEYSNNPHVEYDGDEVTKDKPHGVTPEIETWTYLTEMDLLKTDPNGNVLADAEFTLVGKKVTTDDGKAYTPTAPVFTRKEEFKVIEEDETYTGAKYYKLADGTYTQNAPSVETDEEKANAIASGYHADFLEKAFKKVETITYKTNGEFDKSNQDNYKYEAVYVTGNDGYAHFKGLGAGTYILTETKAPEGYNKLENPITVKVDWSLKSGNNKQVDWTIATDIDKDHAIDTEGAKLSVNQKNNRLELTVKNNKGTTLPSTGGMGTTMFVAGGVALMAVAGVLLVVKKRTAAED